jgi:hypothetical protein
MVVAEWPRNVDKELTAIARGIASLEAAVASLDRKLSGLGLAVRQSR